MFNSPEAYGPISRHVSRRLAMLQQVEELTSKALSELEPLAEPEALEKWRVSYLGRKGSLTQLLRGVSSLPVEERREAGSAANRAKNRLEGALSDKEEALKQQELSKRLGEAIDVTLPGHPVELGRLHPTTQMLREICQAFNSMGFQVVEGPEVEWDYYNFEALNIPQGHPARDMWDTLWIDYETDDGQRPMLLRTHTSPMQIRVMESREPPIRVIVPGRVYRYEATDATHESIFFQVEGLAVDKGITFADLKGTLFQFAENALRRRAKGEVPLRLLPFRRAGRRHVHRLLPLRRARVPGVQRDRVDRDNGSRHGASEGA